MNSLFFNFVKRALIVPLLFALVAIAAVNFVVPKMVESSNAVSYTTAAKIDISKYQLAEFDSFSKLEKGNYVATVSSEEIGLNCAAAYNSSEIVDTVNLLKISTEPWNNGSIAIIGKNLTTEFKYLHNAIAGTEVTVDFYRNSTYTYKINKIIYDASQGDIKKHMAPDTLVMALPYVDFESSDDKPFYILYVAELEGVK